MTKEEKALQYFLDKHHTSTYKEAMESKENAQILLDAINQPTTLPSDVEEALEIIGNQRTGEKLNEPVSSMYEYNIIRTAFSEKDIRIKELIDECDVVYEESQRDKVTLNKVKEILERGHDRDRKTYELRERELLNLLEEENNDN